MKKLLLATTFLAASSAMAFAADLPVKARPMAPEPVYNWTGFYLGVNIGGGRVNWDRSGFYDTNPVDDNFDTSAFMGGGQIGYNWQMAPNWLIGLEGDISGISAKNDITCAAGIFAPTGTCYDSTSRATLKSTWLATIRARVGFLATPNLLLYGTGGVAFGDTEYSINDFTDFPGGFGTLKQTHTGWAAGAGAEYMFARNWTAKIEYMHVDLGSKDYVVPGTNQPDFLASIRPEYDIGRFGVNYHF